MIKKFQLFFVYLFNWLIIIIKSSLKNETYMIYFLNYLYSG